MENLTDTERLKIKMITEVVCKIKQIDEDALLIKRRFRNVVKSRYLFAYLVKKYTELDQKQISRILNVSKALIYVGIERHSDDMRFLREVAEETDTAEKILKGKLKNLEKKLKNT